MLCYTANLAKVDGNTKKRFCNKPVAVYDIPPAVYHKIFPGHFVLFFVWLLFCL